MDSFLTTKLIEKSQVGLAHLNKYKLSTKHIITYSILLNAFAVLNLLNRDIYVFVLLFLSAFYLQLLSKVNKNKRNDTTFMIRYYGRFSVWLMLYTVLYGIYTVYKSKISVSFILVFIVLGILCNINYSLKISDKIRSGDFEDRKDINSKLVKYWGKLFSFINPDTQQSLSKSTRHFDETMMILYFIIGVFYLEYKMKNKN